MVLIGADTEGKKHLLALREGYRESTDSCCALLKDCRKRGPNQPACWTADGALGLWAAIDEQSPDSAQQRCTNHKTMNVIDKLPQAEQPEAVKRVRAIWQADSEKAARKLAGTLIADFRSAGWPTHVGRFARAQRIRVGCRGRPHGPGRRILGVPEVQQEVVAAADPGRFAAAPFIFTLF